MKKILTIAILTLVTAALCFAGSATGFVTDAKCAKAGKGRRRPCRMRQGLHRRRRGRRIG